MFAISEASIGKVRPLIKPLACITVCLMFIITLAVGLFRYISSLQRELRQMNFLRRENAQLLQERNARIPRADLEAVDQARLNLEAVVAERDARIAQLEAVLRQEQGRLRALQEEQRWHLHAQHGRIIIEQRLEATIRRLETELREEREQGAEHQMIQYGIQRLLITELEQSQETLKAQEQRIRELLRAANVLGA